MVTCTAVYAMYAFSISIYSHALHSIQLESFANHSYMQTKNERNGKKAKQNHYYECRTKYECGFFKEHYQIFIYLMLFRAFNCDHLKTEL